MFGPDCGESRPADFFAVFLSGGSFFASISVQFDENPVFPSKSASLALKVVI